MRIALTNPPERTVRYGRVGTCEYRKETTFIRPPRRIRINSYIGIIHMKIKEYLQETRAELTHVSWPTRKQAIVYSIVVIVVSFVTAFYLGAFDYLFSVLLQKVI